MKKTIKKTTKRVVKRSKTPEVTQCAEMPQGNDPGKQEALPPRADGKTEPRPQGKNEIIIEGNDPMAIIAKLLSLIPPSIEHEIRPIEDGNIMKLSDEEVMDAKVLYNAILDKCERDHILDEEHMLTGLLKANTTLLVKVRVAFRLGVVYGKASNRR